MRTIFVGTLIGLIAITATASYSAAQTVPDPRIPNGYSQSPGVGGFGVVLVLADTSSGASRQSDDTVPPAAAKALADIQNLFAFRSYRLLDAQYTAGSSNTVVKLRGPDGKSYGLTMKTGQIMPGRVVISDFRLRELSQGARESQSGTATGPTSTAVTSDKARDGEIIMDTTFSMNIGETVVVGTSRLAGESALVVLLTARPRQ